MSGSCVLCGAHGAEKGVVGGRCQDCRSDEVTMGLLLTAVEQMRQSMLKRRAQRMETR